MKLYDAIVVGGGHNGLVAACYLAKAGLKTIAVEKNDWVGGAAVSRSLYPGFTYSNCSYVASLPRPEIMRELELPKHGLQILPYEGGAVFTQDGDYLAMYRDHESNRREFARFSKRDAENYDRYSRDVLKHCRFIYFDKKHEVGHITAAIWSPTTKRNIALAMLRRPYHAEKSHNLWVEIYALRELEYHKLMVKAQIVPRQFFNPARRRATPPSLF